ncbi:MFS transporter [Actinokineospora soli]|uniref:MFS transporter n=1 Tax=Actinokineospora soli TaxID=1048753 RepID=A0ABW2TJW0_9PSEU
MRPTFRENLAGLRPIRGLLAAVAIARSSVMLFPFYAAYLAVTRDDLSSGAIGVVVGAFGLGALAADMVSGRLSARFAERSLGVAGLGGVAAAVLLVSVVEGHWSLIAATAAWGFCYELVNPVAYSLVAQAMPDEKRRFAFAAVRLAINLGMGLGPVIAGVLFQLDPGLLVWGTALGYLAAAWVLARARVPVAAHAEAESVDGPDPAEGGHERRFWAFFTATLPIHLAYALPPTVISAYVIHQLDHPVGWVSAVFALNAAMVITCEIALNHAMDGWSRRGTIAAGYACAVVGFALMGLGGQSGWWLLAATAVWTLGEMIIFPVLLDHISVITPRRLKTRNMGYYSAGVNVGVIVAPMAFLPMAGVLPPVPAWGVVAAVLGVGMISVLVLSASHRLWGRDERRVAEPVAT